MELERNANILDNLTDIPQKVLDIINEHLADQATVVVSMDSPFPDVDSITFIAIVVTLESQFDFEFDDEMLLLANFPTVNEMIAYVESKVTTCSRNE